MMKAVSVLVMLGLAALALADDYKQQSDFKDDFKVYEKVYDKEPVKEEPVKKSPEYPPMKYYGKFGDRCGGDGIYYRDSLSFVICSNKNHYVLPCAPGSANYAYDHYKLNTEYFTNAFCGVNYATAGYLSGYPYSGYPFYNTFPYGYGGFPYNYRYPNGAPAVHAPHPHAKAPEPKKDNYGVPDLKAPVYQEPKADYKDNYAYAEPPKNEY